jgi:predicted DNA-binding transcriptional regulator AlpA
MNLMTIKDVAKTLRCSTKTIRRKIGTRNFPKPMMLFGGYHWKESDISKWIDSKFNGVSPKKRK